MKTKITLRETDILWKASDGQTGGRA